MSSVSGPSVNLISMWGIGTPLKSQSWISHAGGQEGTNSALVQSSLVGAPIIVPYRTRFDAVGIRVTATALASSIRIGIYDARDGGLPYNLKLEAGSIDTSTVTGDAIITGLSLTLSPGLYYLCGVAQGGTPSLTVTPQNTILAPLGFHLGLGSSTQFNFQGSCFAHSTNVTGVLPATFSTILTNNNTNATPRIFLRAA